MTETQSRTDDAVPESARTTFREIRQQPEVWRETAQVVREHRPQLTEFLRPLLERPELRVVFTGAGTSAFTGGVVAPTIARATGRRVEAIATTDLVSNPRHYLAEDVPTLLVSFARSGNSPESVATTQLADALVTDSYHLVITCNADGELAHELARNPRAFVLTLPERTHDVGFAMTSSFTSMLLAALLVFLGDADAVIGRVADAAETVLEGRWAQVAGRANGDTRRLVYLGSGPLAALAQESALKLLELTAGRTISYHDSSLGFRHGPKAVLDDTTLAVVFVSGDPYTRSYDLDILGELRAALGPERVLAVSPVALDGVDGLDDAIVFADLEDVDDGFLSAAFVVVAQILAFSFALAVGTTPDNPFPGGAVNRVVKGVRIHPLGDEGGAGGAGAADAAQS
jgi:tagatose-6-phosphate ketose/aldose isomerase